MTPLCSIICLSKTYILLLFQPVSGAEGLLSIGAIEFLSHLRQDIDPELYQNVDNVIHQLLSLPQKDATDHDQLCLYKDHENHVKNDHQQSSGTGSTVLSSFSCIIFNFSKNYIILLKKEHSFLKESTLELACARDKTKPPDYPNFMPAAKP